MVMKRIFLILLSIVLVVAVVFGGYAKPALAEEIKLSWAMYFPATLLLSKLQGDLCREIEKRTDGRVRISYYPGGTLVSSTEVLNGVIRGIADVGYSHSGYNPGRFLVSEATGLPIGHTSAWVRSHSVRDFVDKFKPKELDAIHVLWTEGPTNHCIATTKPVRKLEDLRGLVLRGSGMIAEIETALGATPRDVPMMELYEAGSRGVVNGSLEACQTLLAFKLAEVFKYNTLSWQVAPGYFWWGGMNKAKWNTLPSDIQKIIAGACDEYTTKVGRVWDEMDISGLKHAIGRGNEIIKLTPEEGDRWRVAVRPVIEKYVRTMMAAGFSEKEVRGWIEFIRERNEYWTKKRADLHIPYVLDYQ